MIDPKTLGERIRKRRKELGITLIKFAEDVGVSKSTLSQIETGQTKSITVDTMLKICNGLGESIYNLYSELEILDPDTDERTAFSYYKKAIESYTKAIEMRPNFSMSYKNRGDCYAKIGYYRQALDDYYEALKWTANLWNQSPIYARIARMHEALSGRAHNMVNHIHDTYPDWHNHYDKEINEIYNADYE